MNIFHILVDLVQVHLLFCLFVYLLFFVENAYTCLERLETCLKGWTFSVDALVAVSGGVRFVTSCRNPFFEVLDTILKMMETVFDMLETSLKCWKRFGNLGNMFECVFFVEKMDTFWKCWKLF